MPTYKEQLLAGLTSRGWERVEIDEEGTDWWADEHWRIRSIREAWGLDIVLTFLVDPNFVGPRKKGQAICAIGASADTPCDRLDVLKDIELCMYKRRFDEKLESFLGQLDEYRRKMQVQGSTSGQ